MCGSYFDKGDLIKDWNEATKKLTGYHVHIYVNEPADFSSFQANDLAQRLTTLFPGDTDGPHTVGKVGPHTRANVEVDITNPESFGKVVAWLQLNNTANLSILIHPRTGDELKDHLGTALWLGEPVAFNDKFFDMVRQHQDTPKKGPKFG